MKVNDKTKAILKVQLGLNYLKLCADHENPLGGGIPVDIVALPDFVADMDGYAVEEINKDNQAKRLSSAEVGSRAGRILSILAHLRDLDDESFNLHYIAKTGDIGRAVLNKRLNTDLRMNHIQPLSFPFLMNSKETRFTILGRYKLEKTERQVVTNNDIITKDELSCHFYKPLDKLSDASVIYFGTDSAKQFNELIKLVLCGSETQETSTQSETMEIQSQSIPSNHRYIFIDLSALEKKEDKIQYEKEQLLCENKLKECIDLRNKQKDPSVTHLIVMVAGKNSESSLWNEYSLREGDTLLIYDYDSETMLVKDGDNNDCCISLNLPYGQRPGSRESFVAGFLLHRALAAAWRRIPPIKKMRHVYSKDYNTADPSQAKAWKEDDWPQGLFPNPYSPLSIPEKDWPLSEAVEFGGALTKLWNKEETHAVPDKRELLLKNLEKSDLVEPDLSSPILSSNIEKAISVIQNSTNNGDPYQFFIQVSWITKLWHEGLVPSELKDWIKDSLLDFIDSKDLSIQPKLWSNTGNKRSHTLVMPSLETIQVQYILDMLRYMSMSSQWIQKSNEPKRACLFDLDGTLMQSSNLRKTCLRRAFLAIIYEDLHSVVNNESLLNEIIDDFPVFPKEKYECLKDIPMILERCIYLYHLTIYRRWQGWKEVFRSYPYYAYGDLWKDFRQVWNHPLSYPIFIAVLQKCLKKCDTNYSPYNQNPLSVIRLATDDHYHQKIKENIKIILDKNPKNLDYDDNDDEIKKKIELRRVKELMSGPEDFFQQEVAMWETRYKKTFQAGVNSYWKVNYHALPHTKQLLRTLRDVQSVMLYVATEGHHDTQLAKLSVTGLDEFFPEYRTLSTGAAATPTDHLRNINKEINKRENIIIQLDGAREGIKRLMGSIDTGLRTIDGTNIEDKYKLIIQEARINEDEELTQEKKVLSKQIDHLDFYKQQWNEYEGKQIGAIFSLVIASIMANPDKPVFNNFRHLELELENDKRKAQSLSFVMIGDRESKDICPLLKCWNENPSSILPDKDPVTTIRLLTLDHCDEGLYWLLRGGEKEKDPPLARYVAWNPQQVMLLLTHNKNWPEAQGYYTIPPIMTARLLNKDKSEDLQKDQIDETWWSIMAWGEQAENETFALMNRIITRCSIQGVQGESKRLAQALSVRLEKSIYGTPDYSFAWTTMERLLTMIMTLGAPSEEIRQVAEVIRDTLCFEIKRLESENTKIKRNRQTEIGNLVMMLINRGNKALCEAPENWENLLNFLTSDGTITFKSCFEDWGEKGVITDEDDKSESMVNGDKEKQGDTF